MLLATWLLHLATPVLVAMGTGLIVWWLMAGLVALASTVTMVEKMDAVHSAVSLSYLLYQVHNFLYRVFRCPAHLKILDDTNSSI